MLGEEDDRIWTELIFNLGLDARKSDFIAHAQLRCRPACASTQSGQHLSCSPTEIILNQLARLVDWFVPYMVANSKNRFSCDVAH